LYLYNLIYQSTQVMSIEFKLDQYFYLLFPSFSKDQTTLIKEVEQYYTINDLKPEVELTGDLIVGFPENRTIINLRIPNKQNFN